MMSLNCIQCARIRIRYDKRNPGEDLKIWVEIGAQDRRSEFRDCCYHGLKNMICVSVSHFLALPFCLLLWCYPVQIFLYAYLCSGVIVVICP
jgi:hypothetical protein